jgi:hypothetical protein
VQEDHEDELLLFDDLKRNRGRSTLSGSALFNPDVGEHATLVLLQPGVDDGW